MFVPFDACESVISQNLAEHKIDSRGNRECRGSSLNLLRTQPHRMDSRLIFTMWFFWVSILWKGFKRPQTCAARLDISSSGFPVKSTSLDEC